ncbi:CAF17-like 4Fe-4S cluster assembly/insertion protein YgfZ [Chitinilyticum piscinae]|uniref:Folate-binding protein YgfZ n=1 Tax=Chitinilyticum piscinae TaxID=2866724 RepID=A0A8J7KEZ9_9NEIS|nr:folate-binding protein YgfZ [Chitinilyticum piscinae]MBE9609864.1 folate-binding protein YgfZ [Chitinilyticum piscinae]
MAWQSFLDAHGATLNEGRLTFPQQSASPTDPLEQGAALIPLAHLGLIRFSGEESASFLQGQLSSDIREVDGTHCQLSSYSTPKGRMQASFVVFRRDNDYLLQVYGDLQESIQKRLGMFILRSKTRTSDASTELAGLALIGAQAEQLIISTYSPKARIEKGIQEDTQGGISILRLSEHVFHLFMPFALLATEWQKLTAAGARAAGTDSWALSQIRSGTPWVSKATYEEFVPQMANLELVGGVSFNKGCYPGQEIVARTQYLGKTKRRMYRCTVKGTEPLAGQHVYSAELPDQSAGTIMLAAPSGNLEWEVLVVARIDHIEQGLHLGSMDGPLLVKQPLPYSPD